MFVLTCRDVLQIRGSIGCGVVALMFPWAARVFFILQRSGLWFYEALWKHSLWSCMMETCGYLALGILISPGTQVGLNSGRVTVSFLDGLAG